jgi:hypothetical protein
MVDNAISKKEYVSSLFTFGKDERVKKLKEQRDIIEKYAHDEVLLFEKLGLVHELRHVGSLSHH